MDHRKVCIANLKYKKPGKTRQMQNLIKYLTYRESGDEKARFEPGVERWMDRGLGRSVSEIAERSAALQSEHVLMFSLVINPNPELMAMVPEGRREALVRELTEQTVDTFFEARGIDSGVEWSAVLHHRQTISGHAPTLHNPHMHVVLPGTYYDPDEGIRKPLYFSQRNGSDHIARLHRLCEQHSIALFEREIGRDWEQRYDAMVAGRDRDISLDTPSPEIDFF